MGPSRRPLEGRAQHVRAGRRGGDEGRNASTRWSPATRPRRPPHDVAPARMAGLDRPMTSFTTYWAQSTVADRAWLDGHPLEYAGSNEFRARDVASGDRVYVTTRDNVGRLILIGRIIVGAVVDRDHARSQIGREPWDARDHVMADEAAEQSVDRPQTCAERSGPAIPRASPASGSASRLRARPGPCSGRRSTAPRA
jgi:hypothetical protein